MALGFFDGFHLGHQQIVDGAVARAAQANLAPLVFTFKNHPATVLDSGRAPALLTTFGERIDRLLSSGASVVWCEFDRPFSQIEPRSFVQRVLLEQLGVQAVVVGPNYRFGHRAAGDVELLRAMGQESGFAVEVVEPVYRRGRLVSSTRIRESIAAGKVELAAELMGRPYAVRSLVERGSARGRQLGFPTANLSIPPRKVLPPSGVYAVRVLREDQSLPGVANLGVRPTFEEEKLVLEAHLLDFSGDLYGERVEIEFHHRLRDEQRFSGVEALREQIARDVQAARRALA